MRETHGVLCKSKTLGYLSLQQEFEIVEMGKYGQHDDAALMGDGDCAAENELDAHSKIR